MFVRRSIAALSLATALLLGGFSGIVSSTVADGGVWIDGVLDGSPDEAAIVGSGSAELLAEVSPSGGGAVSSQRREADFGAPRTETATPGAIRAPTPAIHLLNCVLII